MLHFFEPFSFLRFSVFSFFVSHWCFFFSSFSFFVYFFSCPGAGVVLGIDPGEHREGKAGGHDRGNRKGGQVCFCARLHHFFRREFINLQVFHVLKEKIAQKPYTSQCLHTTSGSNYYAPSYNSTAVDNVLPFSSSSFSVNAGADA